MSEQPGRQLTDVSDRRAFPRQQCDFKLSALVGPDMRPALSTNISCGGLCLQLIEPVGIGTLLLVRLVPTRRGNPILQLVRIVHVVRDSLQLFTAGAEFIVRLTDEEVSWLLCHG